MYETFFIIKIPAILAATNHAAKFEMLLYWFVRLMAVFSTLTPDYATHLVNGMPRIGKPNTTRTVPFTDLEKYTQ